MADANLAQLYNRACHGGGAEARIEARLAIRALAEDRGTTEGEMLRSAGLDLAVYFASRPITFR